MVRTRQGTDVKRGDGLVFDHGNPEEEEQGGSVYDILVSHRGSIADRKSPLSQSQSQSWSSIYDSPSKPVVSSISDRQMLVFGTGAVDLRKVSVGDLVWRSRDHALEGSVRSTLKAIEGGASFGTDVLVGVQLVVSGKEGQSLRLELWDGQGRVGVAESSMPLQLASNAAKGLSGPELAKAIGTDWSYRYCPCGRRIFIAFHIPGTESAHAILPLAVVFDHLYATDL